MKPKKITALLLFFALIAGILISCGGGAPDKAEDGNKADVNVPDEQGGETDENAGEPRIEPELPDMDFGGYKFTFLTLLYDGDDWVGDKPFELVAEEITGGDPINDAVFKRNMKIMEKFNIDVEMTALPDHAAALKRAVGAGDPIYDAAVMFNNDVPGIVTNGALTNVDELKFIDLSKPWWDPAVNSTSVANKNFLMAGDLLILDNEATNAVLFNKGLMADLGLELPYDLVKGGKWTMDVFNDYIKGASKDLNGDGKMAWADDQWGFVAFNDTLHALFVAGGGTLALKDGGDIPYMTLTSPRNLSVMDKVFDIMYNKDEVLNVQSDVSNSNDWSAAFYGSFEENRALFLWARLRVVEKYRGMESDFGILPLPKFDEGQDKYHSVVNSYTGVLLGVPKSAENLDRVGIILEALSAESKYTLRPAYYDVVLQRKYTRDEESSEMLDIIFGNRVYDVGAVYSFGGVFLDFIALCNRSNRDIMSYYEKRSGQMEKAIEKTVDIFQSMD